MKKTLHQKKHAEGEGAIASSIEQHRQRGQSISIWQDGKVVTLKAEEIPPKDTNTSQESSFHS